MKALYQMIAFALVMAVLLMFSINISYNAGYNRGKNYQQEEVANYEPVYEQDTTNVEDEVMQLLIAYGEYVDAAETIIQMYYENDSEYYINVISKTLEYKDYINACDKLNEYN